MSTFGRLGSNEDITLNPDNQYYDGTKPMFVKMIDTEGPVENSHLVTPEKALNDTTLPEHLPENHSVEETDHSVKLKNTTFESLINNFSDSMIGIINDLTNVRQDNIKEDIIKAVSKDNRLTNIGVLAIVISVFTLLVKAR
jgi:hypothetical protein